MAFALFRKYITCPNCKYDGKAKIKGSCGAWLAWLAVLLVSFAFPPLYIVAGLMFLYLLFRSTKQICPVCKYEYPIPISRPARPPLIPRGSLKDIFATDKGTGIPSWVKTKEDYERWKANL